ncbi:MAG: DUF167 domain-containing protein [Pseudomonadota bacterium]
MRDSKLPFQSSENGLFLNLHVTAKASRNCIGPVVQEADGRMALKVYVTAVPDAGKANAAVIELLAKVWKIPKSAFAIARGSTHRRKVFEISGDLQALQHKIQLSLFKESS